MKKFLLQLLFSVLAMSLALGLSATVFAQDPIADFNKIINPSGLQNFSGRYHKLSSVEPGADIVTSVIFTTIDFLKYILGGIAVIFVVVSGIKLIASAKKVDEVSEKEKENLKFIIYGLILVITADELITKVFFGDYGECLASASNAQECAQVGGGLIKGIYSLVLAIMASLSIFVIVLSAFRLITSYGEEENIKKQKSRITMAAIGLIISGVAEFVVKGIVFREGGTAPIDVAAAQKLVYNFTNFVSAFIGTGAFIMLFYGGYLYVVSAGNEEGTGKAKKIIISALIGIVIALAAFGIVRTLSTLQTGRELNLPGQIPGLSGTNR